MSNDNDNTTAKEQKQFNLRMFDLNNRLQHLPVEVRQREIKKALERLTMNNNTTER